MKPKRYLSAVFLVTVVTLVGCTGDRSVAGPEDIAPPEASLIGALLRPTGLLRCEPLPYATAAETIGPRGGVLRVGPHTLRVPPGALDEPVTITAEAPSGEVNLVRFQPHGLEFDRTVYLTMSYANCNLLGRLLPKRVAYVNRLLDILYFLPSLDDLWNKRVTGRLEHFSQYAVAW